MRRVEQPPGPPPAFVAFVAAHPDATWDDWKEERDDSVFDSLAAAQGHLCAYCESRIRRPLHGQVEHFIPKSVSGAGNLHLAWENLLACCEGAGRPDLPLDGRPRSEDPAKDNVRCGQRKGDADPRGYILDPRVLPASESVWQVEHEGTIGPMSDSCLRHRVDQEAARQTVDVLGLNTPYLRHQRRDVLRAVDDELLACLEAAASDDELERQARWLAEAATARPESAEDRPFWTTYTAWARKWVMDRDSMAT